MPKVNVAERVLAREKVIASLRKEIHGPNSEELYFGTLLEHKSGSYILNANEIEGPFFCGDDGEEIFNYPPLIKYGVGVLYGIDKNGGDTDDLSPFEELEVIQDELETVDFLSHGDHLEMSDDEDLDVLDLSTTAGLDQSSLGITFVLSRAFRGPLLFNFSGGRYIEQSVIIKDKTSIWWKRVPIILKTEIDVPAFQIGLRKQSTFKLVSSDGHAQLKLHLYFRHISGHDDLIFVTLVSQNISSLGNKTTNAIFQSKFSVESKSGDLFSPHPSGLRRNDMESLSQELQYRKQDTYAIGHGCSGDWTDDFATVSSNVFPTFESSSITAEIPGLDLDMRKLGMEDWGVQKEIIDSLLVEFSNWIDQLEISVSELSNQWRAVGEVNLANCRSSLIRMKNATHILENNTKARLAFSLANEAIADQQLAAKKQVRKVSLDDSENLVLSTEPPNILQISRWRPFQLGFLLQALPDIVDKNSEYRETVDLIFFPTGGGKTEAYLGLSAFAIFYRRLCDANDCGTEVLMRYTLRLLTAQQFTRAASLICCMEVMRRKRNDLGEKQFSIGVWLGGKTTPNSQKDAKKSLSDLKSGHSSSNPFLLLKCPYCATELGSIPKFRNKVSIHGYKIKKSTDEFSIYCLNTLCPFGSRDGEIPVKVIDEAIYQNPPDILIGTVDKFARLTWEDRAKAIFGIGDDGIRHVSPPGLVIQDELHLISGPLGSMAGIYEVVMQDLCTDHRLAQSAPPKIIASTATVSRFGQQIRNLFSRTETSLFPPPGIDAEDNFFSRPDTLEDGKPAPGRIYVGVFAPGYPSFQTIQVHAASALLQAPYQLEPELRDPYWTNLWFFNSIRELGNTLSLLQFDIGRLLQQIRQRDWLGKSRRLFVPSLELTSRMESHEVPSAISKLEVKYSEANNRAVDVCLASNIIEVGIDIDRLGLLIIAGQPKTTSQYIQVSGRIGRLSQDAPGIVVTLYGPTKPRDRSHFEKFRSYHQKMFQFVEPSSVTPFSYPVLKRALHAVLVAYVRMTTPTGTPPYPMNGIALQNAMNLFRKAIRISDPENSKVLDFWLIQREKEWRIWEKSLWKADFGKPEEERNALLRGAEVSADANNSPNFWRTPNSLRNVDAECSIEISNIKTMITPTAVKETEQT